MKKQFEDTAFGRAASYIIDIVWLGILWLVCSLPVVTAGAACCGLYYSMVKSVRHHRGRATKEFFRGFKDNFAQATPVWLIYLAVAVPAVLLPKLTVFYVIPLLLSFPWVFSYISRFSCSFSELCRSVLYLAVKNPLGSLLCGVIIAAAIAIAYLLPGTIPLLPGIICLFVSYQTEPVFKRITTSKEDSNEDKWYNE